MTGKAVLQVASEHQELTPFGEALLAALRQHEKKHPDLVPVKESGARAPLAQRPSEQAKDEA